MQEKLDGALNLYLNTTYQYNLLTKENLEILRFYHYECNQSAGGLSGERRFIGIFKSLPSGFPTIVGMRLIEGQLRVYRIAREFPVHNGEEIRELAHSMRAAYGARISIVDYLSSNAYTEVKERRTEGWFGRSQMFNPSDLSDNAAELVLIDPLTRRLLEPTSMPDSGEIGPIAARIPVVCAAPPALQ